MGEVERADIGAIMRRLTKAQKRAVMDARFCESRGVWHPEGWYAFAERRVRRALCREGLIRDYLRFSYAITPLGLRVRAALLEGGDA